MPSTTIDLTQSTPRDYDPYDYQRNAIAKLDEYFGIGHSAPVGRKSGVIVMPTGSGKTFTSVSWLLEKVAVNGYQIIWLVHQQELVTQAYETILGMSPILKNYNFEKLTIIPISSSPGHYSISQADGADIIVGCIQSFVSRKGIKFIDFITKGKGRDKLVIVIDEAHHASSDSYQLVLKEFEKYNPNFILLGMTATPSRMVEAQKRRFSHLFNVLDNSRNGIGTSNGFIYEVTLKELLKRGQLANPVYRKVDTEINGEVEFEFTDEDRKYLEQFGELSEKVKDKVANSSLRNRIIVNEYIKNRDKYGKTIIFAVNQLHCKTLQKAFADAGISNEQCRYAISDEKEQAIKNIADFKNNIFPILINVQMLTEGFDSPNIQTCFLTRFTQSESLKMQMVGRALRGKTSGGTDVAYIVDFHDMWGGIEIVWDAPSDDIDENKVTCPHCGSTWNLDDITESADKGVCPFCGEVIIKTPLPPPPPEDYIHIPPEVFIRVYSAMRDNLIHRTHKDVIPIGWYTVPDDDGIEQTILVYDHQVYGYQQLENDIKNGGRLSQSANYYIDSPEYFANTFKVNDEIPEDWPPEETELQLLIDYANLSKQMPLFYTFEQRDALDPDQVAEELGAQKFTGNFHEQNRQATEWLLAKHSNTPILRDLYKNPDDFVQAVFSIVNVGKKTENAVTVFKDERGTYEIKPGVYDLIQLRDEVIDEVRAANVVDMNGRPIFENIIRPNIIWSNRIMKSYLGKCYRRGSEDEPIYFIRINRIMSSEQAPRESLKFLIYHELLHADSYWDHDSLFRVTEWKYPNTDVHSSFLDSLNLRFKIVDNGLPMYDAEPEIPKLEQPNPRVNNTSVSMPPLTVASKRCIAFTSKCTYQIVEEGYPDTDSFRLVAPIPEYPKGYYMLFAYSDGRFAKVPLDSYYLKPRRTEYKNAYSSHAPLVWLGLFGANEEIAVFSSIDKVVVFNTSLINTVNSTTSKGVMVQKSKNGSIVAKVILLKDAGLSDHDYYRCARIPAVGVYLKK